MDTKKKIKKVQDTAILPLCFSLSNFLFVFIV